MVQAFHPEWKGLCLGLFVDSIQLLGKTDFIRLPDPIQDHLTLFALEGARDPGWITCPGGHWGNDNRAIKRFISPQKTASFHKSIRKNNPTFR